MKRFLQELKEAFREAVRLNRNYYFGEYFAEHRYNEARDMEKQEKVLQWHCPLHSRGRGQV